MYFGKQIHIRGKVLGSGLVSPVIKRIDFQTSASEPTCSHSDLSKQGPNIRHPLGIDRFQRAPQITNDTCLVFSCLSRRPAQPWFATPRREPSAAVCIGFGVGRGVAGGGVAGKWTRQGL